MQDITEGQLRSAPASRGWSSEALAEKAGVSQRTIVRAEQTDGVTQARRATIIAWKQTRDAAGIVFIGTPDDSRGIRHRRPRLIWSRSDGFENGTPILTNERH